MPQKDFWPTGLAVALALKRHHYPLVQSAAADLGLEKLNWIILIKALSFEPDPLSTDGLLFRDPYMAPSFLDDLLAAFVEAGELVREEDGGHRLSDQGRAHAHELLGVMQGFKLDYEPLSARDLERLTEFLQQVVEACLEAPEPPRKLSLLRSRRLDPGVDAPGLVRVTQYLDDLEAHRDQAHLSSWLHHGIDAHAWEAFSFIWRGRASTVDDLAKMLQYRGHSRDDYAAGVEELIGRGWVETTDEGLQATEAGSAVRQKATDQTLEYFLAPFRDAVDLEELEDLLAGLRDGIKTPDGAA